jgi:hypothetical protein
MKKLGIIYILAFFLCFKSIAQNNTNNAANTKSNFASKLVHNTEMGFLLGEQAAINNSGYYGYQADYIGKVAPGYYYPYPIYSGSDRYSNFTIQHYIGYAVNNKLSMGLSAGFDYYRSNIITPISASIKSTLIPSKRISPILNFDMGYGFIWKNEADKNNKIDKNGGLMMNPSVGFRIKIGNDGSNLNVNIGYKMQKSGYTNNRPEESYFLTETRAFNRLSIRLGFGF